MSGTRSIVPVRQEMWGWKIAAYLFGAGMGAGAYAASCTEKLVSSLAGSTIAEQGMWLGAIVAVVSPSFLIWELGKPKRFLYVFRRPQRSWLSRGAIILVTFGVFAAVTLLLGAPKPLVETSLLVALIVATYTGILLGTMLARPVWNNSVLPGIFLVSGLSTGIALLDLWRLLLAPITGNSVIVTRATDKLLSTHVALLLIELVLVYFLLYIAHSRAPKAVDMIVKGTLSTGFWSVVIGIGLVIPMALLAIASSTSGTLDSVLTEISDAGVILGGYWLRRVVLYAGARGSVQMGLVPFVNRPGI